MRSIEYRSDAKNDSRARFDRSIENSILCRVWSRRVWSYLSFASPATAGGSTSAPAGLNPQPQYSKGGPRPPFIIVGALDLVLIERVQLRLALVLQLAMGLTLALALDLDA